MSAPYIPSLCLCYPCN